MSFIVQSGLISPPLTAGGIAYGTGASARMTTAGTAGQVIVSNGSGAPTWGAGAGSGTATASGSIANGAPVLVNSNGTVSQVAPTNIAFSIGTGQDTAATSGASGQYAASVWHPIENKMVYFGVNFSAITVRAWVGTVSGTSLTLSSPVTIASPGTNPNPIDAIYVSATNRIYLFTMGVYGGASVNVYTISLSGTTLTVQGTDFLSIYYAQFGSTALAYDSANNRLGYFYTNNTVPTMEYAVMTPGASGVTSVSIAGATLGAYASDADLNAVYDPSTQKVLVTFYNSSSFGSSRVFDFSGGGAGTYGSAVVYNSNTSLRAALVYDQSAQKCVVMYKDGSVAGYQFSGQIATISGTTVTWGTKSVLIAARLDSGQGGNNVKAVYNTVLTSTVFVYNDDSNTAIYQRTATVSGSSISASSSNTAISASGARSFYRNLTQIGSNSTVSMTYFVNSSGSATAAILQPSYTSYNLTATNFIGFSNGTFTNGQTATISTIGSINSAQSGLTAGSAYYVLNTGSLSTTAGSPSVFGGTAISASSILVKG